MIKSNTTKKKTKWSIDLSQSEIRVKVKHFPSLLIEGTFKSYDAIIYTDGQDFRTAEVDFRIDASSIETGDEKKDNLLKNHDNLDVLNHEQITYVLTSIGLANIYGNRELWGNLTLVGITRNVKFNVQFGGILNDPWGNKKAIFSIIATIKGSDWGLNWSAKNESGEVLVCDEIDISCVFELKKEVQKGFSMLYEPSPYESAISKHPNYFNL